MTAAADLREPHRLATYLHELAMAFSGFFETSPILRAPDEIRTSRLTLADLTGRTLALGMTLLGMQLPTKM